MIEDKIEIVIPTYNRANYLDKTLNYLLNSPFKDCKITIRDNASSDNTPEICEKYSKLLNNLSILRNNKNIGGSANIWNSYAGATYPYVWVLGDNDYLSFNQCDDFIEAINSEKYDVIICSSGPFCSNSTFNTPQDKPISEYIKKIKNYDSHCLENPARDLALIIERHFFLIITFISSTIYKTSIIDSETIIMGYNYIHLTYPHYPLITKVLNNNLLTYKTENEVVFEQENHDSAWGSNFDWYVNYLECSLLIEDKQIRSFATQLNQNFINVITNQIIVARELREKTLKNNISRLIRIIYKLKGTPKGFIYMIYILLMCYIFPVKIIYFLAKIKNKLIK